MSYSDQTILVTGSNGYIGSLMTRRLLNIGYNVVGLDTNFFGKENRFYGERDQYKFIKKDIRNVTKDDLQGIDHIFHLSALSNDPLGELNPDLTHDINFNASIRLAELAKEVGVSRFLFSSSCSIYGISDSDKSITETGELAPVTAYAKSKVKTEEGLTELSNNDFSVTFLRNATAYGASPKLRLDIVVNNLVGWAKTEGIINILSDGTPWRPLVHAQDICQAFEEVLNGDASELNNEPLNVGANSENYQIRDLAHIIKEKMPSCEIKIGDQSPDSRTYRVNFDKIHEYLPNFDLDWDVPKGVVELMEVYEKYNLTSEQFKGRNFIRLKQLNHLLELQKIDENLFWRDN